MTAASGRQRKALTAVGLFLAGTAIAAPASAQIGFGGAAPVRGAPRATISAQPIGPVDQVWGPLAQLAGRRFTHTDKKGRINWTYEWRWIEPNERMEMIRTDPLHPKSSTGNYATIFTVDPALHAVVAQARDTKRPYFYQLGLTNTDLLIGAVGFEAGNRLTLMPDGTLVEQMYYMSKGIPTDYFHPYHLVEVDSMGQAIGGSASGIPGAPASAGDDDDAIPGAPPVASAKDDDDSSNGGKVSPAIVQTTVDVDGGTYKFKGLLGAGQTIDFAVRPETYARFEVNFCEKRQGGSQNCYLADRNFELERTGNDATVLNYSYVSPGAGTQVQVSIVGYARGTTKKVPYAVSRMITPVTSDPEWIANYAPVIGKVWMQETYDDAFKVKMLYRYVPSPDGKSLTVYARRADQPDKILYTMTRDPDGIVRQVRTDMKGRLPVTFDMAGRPHMFFADGRTTMSPAANGSTMTQASAANLATFASNLGVVRVTTPDRIATRTALSPQAVAEVIRTAPADIAAQQRRLTKWGVLAKLAGTNWATATKVDSPYNDGSKLTMQRFVTFNWQVPGESLTAQQADPFGRPQHAMTIRMNEEGSFEQRVGANGAPSMLAVSPTMFSAPGRWRWSRDEASQALTVADLKEDGSVSQQESLGAITAAKYAELVNGQTASYNQQLAAYKAEQLAAAEAVRKANKGPSLFGALLGAAAGAVLTNGNTDAMMSGMKLGAGGQTAQDEMSRLQANGFNAANPGGVPGAGGGGGGDVASAKDDYFSSSVSSACSMMDEGNYQNVAVSGNPDAQLKTMCGQAWSLYVSYKNALAQGYSAADADRTYQAHVKAAQNAINFFNSAQ